MLLQILGLIFEELMEHPSFPYVFTVVHILVVSHTCINPFIYCWMNRRVRYGFMDVMGEELQHGSNCLNQTAVNPIRTLTGF